MVNYAITKSGDENVTTRVFRRAVWPSEKQIIGPHTDTLERMEINELIVIDYSSEGAMGYSNDDEVASNID